MNLFAKPVTRLQVNYLAGSERMLDVVLVNFDGALRWIPTTELNDLFGGNRVSIPIVDDTLDIQEVLRPTAFTCLRLIIS